MAPSSNDAAPSARPGEDETVSAPPRLFDPARRIRARERARARFADYDFLYRFMLDGLIERMEDVSRPLRDILLIGCPDGSAAARLRAMGKTVQCVDPAPANAAAQGGQTANEDALPFAENAFDLVLSIGTLDTVNDLPGALINIRRVLRPDGLFLGACVGAGSLPTLKSSLLEAEGDRPVPHVHPQIDVRSAGDLLTRTGFAMPVADSETLTVRYASLIALMQDLRGMGLGNVLSAGRAGPLARAALIRAAALFAERADPDGKTAELFSILYFSGWKPDPAQPKAARRGSAVQSLANALHSRV